MKASICALLALAAMSSVALANDINDPNPLEDSSYSQHYTAYFTEHAAKTGEAAALMKKCGVITTDQFSVEQVSLPWLMEFHQRMKTPDDMTEKVKQSYLGGEAKGKRRNCENYLEISKNLIADGAQAMMKSIMLSMEFIRNSPVTVSPKS